MFRKFGLGLLFITATLSSEAYSMVTHKLLKGVSMEYDLPTNDPQVFTNFWWGPVVANCTITTEDKSDALFIVALARKGKVNEIELSVGGSIQLEVHPGDKLKLSADSGAKVEITNFGEHTVKAVCTT
ncbi:MAG: hypothetical protein HYX60_10450 [Legionella longbeachae]|nr:hypothetical protein [Legionella longbeachae]